MVFSVCFQLPIAFRGKGAQYVPAKIVAGIMGEKEKFANAVLRYGRL
jgi:hypothetical protein